MTTLKSEDWWAILRVTAEETGTAVNNGTLKPPCTILITDGDDEVVAELEFKIDATGKLKSTPLSPNKSLTAVTFPISYTVTDSEGKEMEAVLSEEVVRNLRKVS